MKHLTGDTCANLARSESSSFTAGSSGRVRRARRRRSTAQCCCIRGASVQLRLSSRVDSCRVE
jgi:hypothetical protein